MLWWWSFRLIQFNALLDCIYLTSLSVPPEEAAADCEDVSPTVPNIRKAWTRLHCSLSHLFRLSLAQSPLLNPLDYLTLAMDRATHGSSQSDQVLRMVYEKATMVTREVLCKVDREDLSLILEELSEMVCLWWLCVLWLWMCDGWPGLQWSSVCVCLLCELEADLGL